MPDLRASPTLVEPQYLTVEDIAYHTGRSPEMVRRFIRENIVLSIKDPSDGRRRLVADTEIPVILRQRQRGTTMRTVALTLSDGSTIHRRIRGRKEVEPTKTATRVPQRP